jgi:hypothetical protein
VRETRQEPSAWRGSTVGSLLRSFWHRGRRPAATAWVCRPKDGPARAMGTVSKFDKTEPLMNLGSTPRWVWIAVVVAAIAAPSASTRELRSRRGRRRPGGSGPVCFGDDADALGLEAQGDDLALEFLAGLLEGTDVSHVTSPCCFRARDHRGLDGDLKAEGDRRRTHLGRSAAQDGGGRLSCLARNGQSPGEESRSVRHCGSGDRGVASLRLDQANERQGARVL